MEEASSCGATLPPTTETSSKTISTAKESIDGPTAEFIMDTGSTTKWKARGRLHGVTDADTSEAIKMIKNTVTAPSNGPMEGSTLENGAKASSTAKEFI